MISGRQLPVIDVPFKSRTQIWLHLLTKISMYQSRTAWHCRRFKFQRFGVRLFNKMAIESEESLVLLKLTYFRTTHFSVIRWIWSLDKLSSWFPPQQSLAVLIANTFNHTRRQEQFSHYSYRFRSLHPLFIILSKNLIRTFFSLRFIFWYNDLSWLTALILLETWPQRSRSFTFK